MAVTMADLLERTEPLDLHMPTPHDKNGPLRYYAVLNGPSTHQPIPHTPL